MWWTGPDAVEVLDNLVATWKDLLATKRFAIIGSDRAGDKLALQYLEESLARAGLHEAVKPQTLSFQRDRSAATKGVEDSGEVTVA